MTDREGVDMPKGTCSAEGCLREDLTNGHCSMHYQRWRKHGDFAERPRKKSVPCAIADCGKVSTKRGWCDKHYRRWLHNGDPETVLRKVPLAERLESLADKSGGVDACWPWTGRVEDNGYGRIGFADQENHIKVLMAHRLAYEVWVGPIPDGLTIDHVCHDPAVCTDPFPCRHRSCVNPAHLEPVSRGENSVRGGGPSGQNARKTHCLRGHELSGDNLGSAPTGTRRCLACQNHRARLSKANA